ncbi:unnamed protein product, partial [Pleuronectes platessa]
GLDMPQGSSCVSKRSQPRALNRPGGPPAACNLHRTPRTPLPHHTTLNRTLRITTRRKTPDYCIKRRLRATPVQNHKHPMYNACTRSREKEKTERSPRSDILRELFRDIAPGGATNANPHRQRKPYQATGCGRVQPQTPNWRHNYRVHTAISELSCVTSVQRLLCYDQAPAHTQRRVSVPVHHLPDFCPSLASMQKHMKGTNPRRAAQTGG